MSTVAILGCGPAGLLAAHAAQQHGHDIKIITPQREKSVISGAQYLHSAIPGITTEHPDGHLTYTHVGDRGSYAEKIYGHHDAPCSWETYPDRVPVPAWSLRDAYGALWRCYRHAMHVGSVDPYTLFDVASQHDLVFSTAPRKLIQGGVASHESVWIKEHPSNFRWLDDNTVHYNGNSAVMFYRASNIFGHTSMEWPDRTFKNTMATSTQMGDIRLIHKPLSFKPQGARPPDNVHFMGRYGQWQKGVLVDHVFAQANKILEAAS